MKLQEYIARVRARLEQGSYSDSEAAVRQGIIDPLLRLLGWDTDNVQCVVPEYSVGGGRVDYALCHPSKKPRVFIEAKAVGKVKKAAEQLFRYDSHERVSIAVATDGRKWIFFHPTGVGTREERKIHELDLTTRSVEKNAKILQEYLGYVSVLMGKADAAIKRDYKNIVNQRETERRLPDLVEQEDESLVKIVADKTQGLSVFCPTNQQVIEKNGSWTEKRFREELLSTQKYREWYESRNKIKKICKFGTDLMNFVEEKQWELDLKFNKGYFAFYFRDRLIFGVILQSSKALYVKLPADVLAEYNNDEYTYVYDDRLKRGLYPADVTVIDIKEVLERTYLWWMRKASGLRD